MIVKNEDGVDEEKNLSLQDRLQVAAACVYNCARDTRIVCVCVVSCGGVCARACVCTLRTCVRACVRACVQLCCIFVLNMHLREQLMQQRRLLSRTFLMSQTAKPKVHERVRARAPTPAWHAYTRTQLRWLGFKRVLLAQDPFET